MTPAGPPPSLPPMDRSAQSATELGTTDAQQQDAPPHEPPARQSKQRSLACGLLTFISIGWFLSCCLVAVSLTCFSHWSLLLLGLTPLPSLLVPLTLGWILLLLVVYRRALPWGFAALIPALVLTPFELGTWKSSRLEHRRSAVEDQASELRILTTNAGKRDREELLRYTERHSPDLVAVQAARLPEDASQLQDWHLAKVDRLSLWSRWPIRESEPLDVAGRVFAARFNIAWPPEPLTVYVIHFPSPRESLAPLTPDTLPSHETRRRLREHEQRQLLAWEILSNRVADEPGPTFVVGDANQPSFGPSYRKFVGSLQDGHRRAGWGFGYTLQNVVNSQLPSPPFAWARIDYILANSKLEFLEHQTEPPHPGQHRAVFARVRQLTLPSAE